MTTAQIIAGLVVFVLLAAFVLSRGDEEAVLPDAPEEVRERPAPVLPRREREDLQIAAIQALDRGHVAKAYGLWVASGGTDEGFERLRREDDR